MPKFSSREEYERAKAERQPRPRQAASTRSAGKPVRATAGSDTAKKSGGLGWQFLAGAGILAFAGVAIALLLMDKTPLTERLAGAQRLMKPPEWREFAPAKAGFSIQMLGEPVRTSKTVSFEGTSAAAQVFFSGTQTSGKNGYTVFYFDLPAIPGSAIDANALFKRVTESTVAELKGRLVNEKALIVGQWPGREVYVENDQEACRTLMFLVNGRFYQVIAAQPRGAILSDDVQWFLSSFKLTMPDGQVLTPGDAKIPWFELAPAGGNFQVELPGAPLVSQETVATSAGNMLVYHFDYKRDESNEVFSVQYADYPDQVLRKMKTAEAVLSGAGSVEIEQFKGTLVSQKTLTGNPYPGKELHAESTQAAMRLRVYLVNGRLYKVVAVRPKNMIFTAEDGRFMDSFRVGASDKAKAAS